MLSEPAYERAARQAEAASSFRLVAVRAGQSMENTFTLPAGKTYIIWANQFDAHGVAATLVQFQISGLP